MSTLGELKSVVAGYLHRSVNDFQQNGVDLLKVAANNALKWAQQRHDFSQTLSLVSLSVPADPGYVLVSTAVDVYDASAAVDVRKIANAYLVVDSIPVAVEMLPRRDVAIKRAEWRRVKPGRGRYPANTSESAQYGLGTFLYQQPSVRGHIIGIDPAPSTAQTVQLDAFLWLPELDSEEDTNFMLQDGFEFMMWQTLIEVNHLHEVFVSRQEGNLAPPTRHRDAAFDVLVRADSFLVEDPYLHIRR